MKISFKTLKWLGLLLMTLILALFLRNPAIAQTPRHYTDLTYPPLKEIQLPDYERYQLDNGLVVYLIEDHQLPLISGSAIFRTGSRLEPNEKVGLAQLTGTVMRTGGTKQYSPAQLNELLEQRAAIIETSIDHDSGTASFNALSEDIDIVFEAFSQVIREPRFDEEQFDLAKTQQKGAIARRNDDPQDIAGREFRKLIYGDNSPYARVVEYTTLNNIARNDLVNFHQTYLRPDTTILGIVGDFDPQQMKQRIEEVFGNWQVDTPKPDVLIPKASQKNTKGVFMVHQPQLTQSSILLGQMGGRLDDPDYPALSVLNSVMSGFGGRLFNELRSRQGLAYSVYGVWSPAYDYSGLFIAGGQTRSETTVPFVKSLQAEIERLRTTPITQVELDLAKDSILNSFVFKFEDPSQTLARLMRYEYYGYPEDFIFQYQRGVKATTIEDILRVAKTHLHPDQMITLVVGNSQEIQPPLKNLSSEVKSVDIAIPDPQQS